ncbi:hypothetical protein KAFR_0A01850 [Kazachstania africana CBS 2517]|uniref:N-alpha-acetyltransferase 40 n=1 Tax=Kazachstania africana (strain ATCC 22294 / BCRC 22015 / CBS 2517 / CECT 1963 / NBRC 1671 / NRRL Y-8276) TaxID=1071382 RepID=H2AMM3_KAZAF|nr:hypothetical protein KAFR_0A01850 [Kazachstania africana CBS 2517]CCF55623.1 hypothetical protein KAFR_0A01850 [Kazachstania africana CBS 2517]
MENIEIFNGFLKIVSDEFPKELRTKGQNLKRKILYIASEDEENKESDSVINEQDDLTKFTEGIGSKLLDSFLEILDNNLGNKYEKISREIYDNNDSWKKNKLVEMKSPGLIYVSYWKEEAEKKTCALFLSFMLTEEDFVVDDIRKFSVIYLYEIQLIEKYRGCQLGTRLIKGLSNVCQIAQVKIRPAFPLIGIQLTVFSDNKRAIKFYERIGMKFTYGSPKDEVDKIESRKTRTSVNRKTLKVVRKPIYYLLYLPV